MGAGVKINRDGWDNLLGQGVNCSMKLIGQVDCYTNNELTGNMDFILPNLI